MAQRSLPERHDDEPSYVLHVYPYKETSLIVEAFVRDHGRVGMMAKGAKRPHSELRGLLHAFQPITLSWGGSAELKTLVKAEWRGGVPLPAGRALLSAFIGTRVHCAVSLVRAQTSALPGWNPTASAEMTTLAPRATVASPGSTSRRNGFTSSASRQGVSSAPMP